MLTGKIMHMASIATVTALTGCQAMKPASEPRAAVTPDGRPAMTSTCRSTIFAITESACHKKVLSMCAPGARVIDVETSSRLTYTPHGYMRSAVWTYLIKGCHSD